MDTDSDDTDSDSDSDETGGSAARAAAEVLAHLPGAVGVSVHRVVRGPEPAQQRLRCVLAYGLPAQLGAQIAELSVDASASVWGRTAWSKCAALATPVDEPLLGAAPAAFRVGSCLAVPACRDELVLGVVTVYFEPEHAAGEVERAVLSGVARLYGLTLASGAPVGTPANAAMRDALTGLPGRTLLLDHLSLTIHAAARSGTPCSVLFLDVNEFKTVNDSLGHGAGDIVLQEVARRLTTAVRPMDTVARIGGDEFVVLCPDLGGQQEAAAIASRLVRALAEPVAVPGQQIRISVSIGIAFGAFASAEDALRQADTAMYRAKAAGGGHRFYDESMQREAAWRLHVQSNLPELYDGGVPARTSPFSPDLDGSGRLELAFQPQFRFVSGRISAVEALVRWRHPTRGVLAPAHFLPVAEQTGQGPALGRWVLREATRVFAKEAKRTRTLRYARLCVNVSASQLHPDGRLAAVVDAALSDSGLPPEQLTLEMTEASLFEDPQRVGDELRELRERGVQIALDDLGIGFSSLSLLHALSVDVVKIDRSFIAELPVRPRSMSMVSAITRLGHALGARVCAEGLERPDQVEAVRSAGCDDGQGFLLARPSRLEDVVTVPWAGSRAGGRERAPSAAQ